MDLKLWKIPTETIRKHKWSIILSFAIAFNDCLHYNVDCRSWGYY